MSEFLCLFAVFASAECLNPNTVIECLHSHFRWPPFINEQKMSNKNFSIGIQEFCYIGCLACT